MALQLTIRDESTDGKTTGETVVEFLTERVTVEELIRSRVYQEVQDYNREQPAKFHGLVRPVDAEAAPDGFQMKTRRPIDWKVQFEAAKEAFQRNQVLILVDDRQLDRLDETIDLRPSSSGHEATRVTFLKLTPLVGG
jgi:hypothetical protein